MMQGVVPPLPPTPGAPAVSTDLLETIDALYAELKLNELRDLLDESLATELGLSAVVQLRMFRASVLFCMGDVKGCLGEYTTCIDLLCKQEETEETTKQIGQFWATCGALNRELGAQEQAAQTGEFSEVLRCHGATPWYAACQRLELAKLLHDRLGADAMAASLAADVLEAVGQCIVAAPMIEYVGLWEDGDSCLFSDMPHRIQYDYECDEYDCGDEAYNNGWKVWSHKFLDDLRGYVARMKAAGVHTAYWAIQDGNQIFSSFGASTEWQRYGRAHGLNGTTVPETSSESYGLVLGGFVSPDGSPALLNVKGGAWQNAVYKITLAARLDEENDGLEATRTAEAEARAAKNFTRQAEECFEKAVSKSVLQEEVEIVGADVVAGYKEDAAHYAQLQSTGEIPVEFRIKVKAEKKSKTDRTQKKKQKCSISYHLCTHTCVCRHLYGCDHRLWLYASF